MVMCNAHVEQLRDKRKQWIECLDGNDVNSISNQLVRVARTCSVRLFEIFGEFDGSFATLN